MLLERRIDVSYETVRRRDTKFGPAIPRHHGKKERMKTPIEGFESGCPALMISVSSRIAISMTLATVSIARRGNGSINRTSETLAVAVQLSSTVRSEFYSNINSALSRH